LRNAINRTLPARHPTASARNEIVAPRAVYAGLRWVVGRGVPFVLAAETGAIGDERRQNEPPGSDGLLADLPSAVGLADAGDDVAAERGAGAGLVGLGQRHLDVLRRGQVAHQPPEVGVAGVLVPDLVLAVDRERPVRAVVVAEEVLRHRLGGGQA